MDESTDRPARGVPGAVANQAPLAADLQIDTPVEGDPAEFKQRSSSNVKNYEVSKKLSTTVGQIGKIRRVKTAVLVKNKAVESPGDSTALFFTKTAVLTLLIFPI